MIKRTKNNEAMILGIVNNCRGDPKRLFTQDDKLRLLSEKTPDENGLYGCEDCLQHFRSEELTVDHKRPWSLGGRTELSNAQLLCRACNSKKSNMNQKKNMRRTIIVCLMLCLIYPISIEAKKRPCGNGVYWELTDAGALIISGDGKMDDYWDKAPWFSSRNKIKTIIIEEGITYIGNEAFCLWKSKDGDNLPHVDEVRIPKTLNTIHDGAFLNTSVSKVIIYDLFLWCNIDFGFASNPLKYGARLYYNNYEIRNLKIPAGITKVKRYAFTGCKSLTSVDLNMATSIGKESFSGCSNLTSVLFSNGTDTIDSGAFRKCNLSTLSIPKNVRYIGKYAFDLDAEDTWRQKSFTNQILCLPKWFTEKDKKEWQKCGLSEHSVKQYISSVHNKNGEVVIAPKYGRKIEKCCFSANDIDYYVVEEEGKRGLINSAGLWVIPQSSVYSEISVDKNYIKVKSQNSYGIFTLDGKEIIPTSRGYTSISNSGNMTFAFTKKGFSGVCDAQGREISTTRLAPTADDIKTNGGYASVVEMKNGSTKYYKVSKGGRFGLTDSEGKEIIPCEMEAMESAGTGYLKYKINGFWGLMNYAGKILIDTDRGYTSIGDFMTFTKRFPYTMAGYKGECDINGRPISKIKVETPKQAVAKQEMTTPEKQEKEQKIIIEHKHDPVPMQVWVQCNICWGSGKCQVCGGTGIFTGWSGNKSLCEFGCGGSGRCSFCAGNGGHYEVQYK